jgi:hypothetical protein
MTRETRRIVTFILPALHLLWCCAIQFQIIPPSEGSWTWFPVFVSDFPGSILVLLATNLLPESLAESIPPLLTLGIGGTFWWYWLSGAPKGGTARKP